MFLALKLFCVVATAFTTASASNILNVKPFRIDLESEIPRLKSLIKNTRLPAKDLYPAAGLDKGLPLDSLRQLQTDWLENFDWGTQQAALNEFSHYTVVIEGQTVHFVHEKSKDPGAIPVILLHGWPGSFHEFSPIIKPLTESWTSNAGKNVSYNVVVPSLPGFVFSSPPPANWTMDDTARIFNTLMTDVLGYSTYAIHGTDWGSVPAYTLYSSFNLTVRAAQLVFIPFLAPSPEEIAANNITLSDIQKVAEQRSIDWGTTDQGYFTEQTTKPNDIGLALYDNPVGQLAWIAGLMKRASDPRAGTPPSVLDNTAILTSVSLYYLTDSFPILYAPLLFSQYEYNPAFWPEEYIAKIGNLVSYKVHDFGGHFAGLDNPPALIEDIREMGLYFKA
ncbi:Epoxide hydrolase domain protein [Mycena venus]|uniref:Epoxide hydrolase domain protein n=1 Tax=Mycena venus TaxID=2733690 RepID=A0A8H6Y1E0_9AGAR|nr:Epoxide hydrolase domain protein [Mycena venus]